MSETDELPDIVRNPREVTSEEEMRDVVAHVQPSLQAVNTYFPFYRKGPTWEKNPDGSWKLPDRTLGWGVISWMIENLRNEEGGRWVPTDEQVRFILWFYAVDDKGKRTHRKSILQRIKSHGKDPLGAAICLAELMGPVWFNTRKQQWDEDGQPIGEPHPAAWVQIAGVNKGATKNTHLLFQSMLPKETRELYNLEVQKEIIRIRGTSKYLEILPAGSAGAEGNRPTFVLMGEIHHWIPSKGGPAFRRTLTRNADKKRGGYIGITNAYMPGQGSALEDLRIHVEKVEEGLARDVGWNYDTLEAHELAPVAPGWSEIIVGQLAGDSTWVPIDAAVETLLDTSQPNGEARRMHYNQIVSTDDTIFTKSELNAVTVYGAQPDGTRRQITLDRGDQIVVGFDGGKTDDATALVAIRVRDKAVIPLGIWQKPEGIDNWNMPIDEITGEIQQMFNNYQVLAFYSDVSQWESYVADWSDRYRDRLLIKATPGKSAVGFDMRGNQNKISVGHLSFVQAIKTKRYSLSSDPLLHRHFMNTFWWFKDSGTTFRKSSPESPNKVDAYAAALLAYIALTDLAESGKQPSKPVRRRLIRS